MAIPNFEDTVRKITKLILTNQQKMIREADLVNLCNESHDFNKVISEVYSNLKSVGFELISSKFLDEKYYVLTSDGKDDNISPSQYGTLALIIALSKEVDDNIKLSDLKDMFSEVWSFDVEFLIQNDYLRKINIENTDIVKITPLGKATLQKVIPNLQLRNLLDVFKKD